MRLVAVLAHFLPSLHIFPAAGATAFPISGPPPPQAPNPGGGPAAAAAAKRSDGSEIGPSVGRNPTLSLAKPAVAVGMAVNASGNEAENGGGVSSRPSHLVVLAHGLVGTPEDLTYVKQSLERAADRAGGSGILVHSARCNLKKTKDGVEKGGTRLAEEIREVVRSTPSLSRISLVGNSLGGLYVRYAAKLLYSPGDGGADGGGAPAAAAAATPGGGGDRNSGGPTVAGLSPSIFMTIASPHLGVRRYTYVPLPTPLHPLAGVFVGKTGHDIFLSRENKKEEGDKTSGTGGAGEGASGDQATTDGRESSILYRMATSEEFLRPLKAFRWRRAYGNRRGDFLVPFGTAAFLEPGEEDGSSDGPFPGATAAAGQDGTGTETTSSAPSSGADDAGAGAAATGTGAFTIMDRLLGAKHGAIVGMSRVLPAEGGPAPATTMTANAEPAAAPGEQQESDVRDESGRRVSARVRRSMHKRASYARQEVRTKRSMEAEMAAGLNSCGWEKVAVDFGGLAPFSHNKICALSRSWSTTALYSSGRSVVDHAANFLVEHDRKFFGDGVDSSSAGDDGGGDGDADAD